MKKIDTDLVRSALEDIIAAHGGVPAEGTTRFWSMIARKLSRQARKREPWDWRYPAQVIKRQTDPGRVFSEAVMSLAAQLDGVHSTSTIYTMQVVVYARPGSVSPNSIILRDSLHCKRLLCPVSFVPVVWNQEYCSAECRELDRVETRANGK